MKGVKENQSRQLANDLRKSHWSFGSSGAKSTASEYVSEYQRKNASLERSQKDKLNVRASHFQLGNQDSHNTFKTISQKDFKEHVGFQAPKLNEDKKRDLRSSHFVLGNSQPQFGSLSHLTFQEKPIPTQQKFEQEVQKTKMRKHNHDFAETNKNQFSSEYNKNFNRLTDPASLKQALSAQELKQKVIDLRKSHVVLGGDHRPMHSIAQLDYQSKQGDLVAPANDNVNIRRTNFQLGTAPAEFGSLYQQNFVAHPTQKSELQGSLAKDLRATHFSLGGEGAIYTSNNAASYKAQIGFKPPQTLNPNLQQNHFSLGAVGDQIINKTTYSSFHKNFGNGAVAQARDQTMDRGSNFQLGGQQGTWASEAQSRFVSHDGAKPGDMDQSLKADLRSSHFRFTDVKPNSQFITVQKQSYGVQKADPNKLDEALKKDLQTNHFKLGSSVTTYGSSTAVAYKFHNGKPSVLDPSLAKDLRGNHFTHGDGKWQVNAGTEYRANFFWKNNEEQTA